MKKGAVSDSPEVLGKKAVGEDEPRGNNNNHSFDYFVN